MPKYQVGQKLMIIIHLQCVIVKGWVSGIGNDDKGDFINFITHDRYDNERLHLYLDEFEVLD